MLDKIRKNQNSLAVKIGYSLIALTFFIGFGLLTGIRQTNKVGTGVVAEVNGDNITVDEYNRYLSRIIDYYSKMYGDNFNDEFMKKVHMREQVVYNLIAQKLKSQEMEKLGLAVDNNTLKEYIAQFPAFHHNGRFDQRLYIRALRSTRPPMKPADFEKEERSRLEVGRFNDLITYSIIFESEELYEFYYGQNEKVNLDFVKFSSDNFINKVKISAKEAENYYTNNSQEFLSNDLYKVDYIFIPYDIQNIKISDKEIEEYYKNNQDKFKHPIEIRASHILIKLSKDSSSEDVKKAKDEITKILNDAKKGKDFKKLAEKYSQGPSAKKGGDLGWFSKGQMVKEFEEVAFKTAPGEITGPVRTSFGLHIIKVTGKKEAGISPLDEVKDKIISELRNEKITAIKNDVKQKVEKSFDKPIKEISDLLKTKLLTTDYFDNKLLLPKDIKDQNMFLKTTYEKKSGEKFKVEGIFGLYVVKIVDKKQPEKVAYPLVKEKITDKLKNNKAKMLAKENANKFLEELKEKKDIVKLAKKYHIAVDETGKFNPIAQAIPGIGVKDPYLRKVFLLKKENPVFNQVIEAGNSYYIVELKEKEHVNFMDVISKKYEIQNKILKKKAQQSLEEWIKLLNEKADIIIHKEAFMPPASKS